MVFWCVINEGEENDHEEEMYDLTYDEKSFYLDGEVFCDYLFHVNNMHLDLWYMDFDSYSFVLQQS